MTLCAVAVAPTYRRAEEKYWGRADLHPHRAGMNMQEAVKLRSISEGSTSTNHEASALDGCEEVVWSPR